MLPISVQKQARISLVASDRAVSAWGMCALATAGALLTGILAQVRIPLPFTPVPVTGQVLGVLICGALLGGGYGCLSQSIYVALGLIGVPWFNGFGAGTACLVGPTGGDLVGFVASALLLGVISKTALWKSFGGRFSAMILAVGIIYFFGILGLMLLFRATVFQAAVIGAAPFAAVDIIKSFIAASLSCKVPRFTQRG